MKPIGYTYSYREKWFHGAFNNLLEAAIFSWMVDSAAYEDTAVHFNGSLVELRRGQFVTSTRFIAEGFELSSKRVNKILQKLEKQGILAKQGGNKGTIITICNYSKYQDSPKTKGKQEGEQGENRGKTKVTNKNKDNKDNKEEVILPPWLDKGLWDDFIQMREQIKKPMSERAIEIAIKKLDGYRAEHDPSKLIEKAILGGHQSFYPDDSTKLRSKSKRKNVCDT